MRHKQSYYVLIIIGLISFAEKAISLPNNTESSLNPNESASTQTAIESLAIVATVNTKTQGTSNIDPLINYNQNAFRFNDKIDKTAIRPIALGYVKYVPYPIRTGLYNFFNNLRDFVTLGNDILQLQGIDSMHNVMRISINSVFGIAGLFDVSSSLGLMRHKNTFGRTMRTYGWKNSSYLIIPFMGPSTIRDTLGLFVDTYFNPTWYLINDNWISFGLFATSAIDTRAQYLDVDQLQNLSINPYMSMRDFYLQSSGQGVPSTPRESSEPNIDELIDQEDDQHVTTESGTKV